MSKEQREQQIINEVDNYRDGDPVMTKLLNRNAAIGLALHIAEWADSHPQWIPVEERLPEEQKSYLFRFNDGTMRYEIFYPGLRLSKSVTHWMEIVPPRKEEKYD